MKIKRLKIIVPIIFLILIISFIVHQYPIKSFNGLMGCDETKITKVFMRRGSDGRIVYTDDKGKIKELIDLLNHRYYMKSFKQPITAGYNYLYSFYVGDDMVLQMTGSGNEAYVKLTKYNVSKEISSDALDKWYNSLPVF